MVGTGCWQIPDLRFRRNYWYHRSLGLLSRVAMTSGLLCAMNMAVTPCEMKKEDLGEYIECQDWMRRIALPGRDARGSVW